MCLPGGIATTPSFLQCLHILVELAPERELHHAVADLVAQLETGGTLDICGDFTMVSDTFNFNGGVLSGNAPVLTNSTLNIGAGSLGAGTFKFRSTGNTLSGDVAPAQTLLIEANGGVAGALNSAAGYTNNGTIVLDNIQGSGFGAMEPPSRSDWTASISCPDWSSVRMAMWLGISMPRA